MALSAGGTPVACRSMHFDGRFQQEWEIAAGGGQSQLRNCGAHYNPIATGHGQRVGGRRCAFQHDLQVDVDRPAKAVVAEHRTHVEGADAANGHQAVQLCRAATTEPFAVPIQFDGVVGDQSVASIQQPEYGVAFAGSALAGEQNARAGDFEQCAGDGDTGRRGR